MDTPVSCVVLGVSVTIFDMFALSIVFVVMKSSSDSVCWNVPVWITAFSAVPMLTLSMLHASNFESFSTDKVPLQNDMIINVWQKTHVILFFMIAGIFPRHEQMLKLTGGNWQKWKRVFLTCPCHEIYRDEAVGLKSCKNTWKITIFVKMWNLGQYRENLIFCQ